MWNKVTAKVPRPEPTLVLVFMPVMASGFVKVPGAPVTLELKFETLMFDPRPLMLMSFPSGTMKVNAGFSAIVAVIVPLALRTRLTVPNTVLAGTVPHARPQFALVIFNTVGVARTAGAAANNMTARQVRAA